MASAHACTLTADEYEPDTVLLDASESTSAASSMSGTETGIQQATDQDTSSPGTVTEGPTPDMLVGNDEAEPGSSGVGSGSAGSGAAADSGVPPVAALPELVGWASVAGLGLATTTGGGSTPAILVQTANELRQLAARPEPLTIAVATTLNVGRLDLASNKTLFGTNASATLRGGIAIRGTLDNFTRNVIVHNLHIDGAISTLNGDAIEVRYAHHVWIDHCEIRDAADGLIDIVRGSDFLTVSRTRFLYTAAAPDPTHRFAALVGHDVTNVMEDQGRLNVTWHHNWWSDNVSRALIARFGSVHLFNNLFTSSGNERVLDADVGARLLVENNVFADVTSPHAIIPGSAASVEAPGNVYLETTGARDVSGAAFVPPYEYQLESALAPLVTADVGPQ